VRRATYNPRPASCAGPWKVRHSCGSRNPVPSPCGMRSP